MRQLTVYIDMDGVLCDFDGAFNRDKKAYPHIEFPQSQKGFYLALAPISGAIEAMDYFLNSEHLNAYILTAPSIYNPLSYTEKRLWVENHLGFEWVKRFIISPDKSLLKGDVLIDDHASGGGQDMFEGKLLHLGSPTFPDWATTLHELMR